MPSQSSKSRSPPTDTDVGWWHLADQDIPLAGLRWRLPLEGKTYSWPVQHSSSRLCSLVCPLTTACASVSLARLSRSGF